VSRRSSPLPSCARMYSSYSPVRSDAYAIHFRPATTSATARARRKLFVRSRISPCFAGTVNTSPRAPISARAPEGRGRWSAATSAR
jgi:hypothetical protein